MQIGDIPEPQNDPSEHSACTASIDPLSNPENELGLGDDNNQLMVCHCLLVD